MNFLRAKWSVFVCIVCLTVASVAYGAERKLFVVGEEFPPFEFIQDGQVVGIDIDVATHIFQKMNIPVEFQIFPWKRAWKMVENGAADAVLTTSRKEAREPYVWYPQEDMWVSEFVFFVKKDKVLPDFKGYETAVEQKLAVGFIKGNSYHPSFWRAFPNKDGSTTFQGDLATNLVNEQLEGARDLKTNLKKLAKGRIDLFPADKIVGQYTAKLLGLQDQLTYYDIALYSKGYPVPFVKNSTYPDIQQIAEQFEQQLKQLKQSGEYQKFLDKWLQ